MSVLAFNEFPKMARLSREIIVTEKIDGTNAQILIVRRDALLPEELDFAPECFQVIDQGLEYWARAGSRTRWLRPGDDNYGFAAWVGANLQDLIKLGEGRHFGEWWGQGIQRRYNQACKRFSLFNVSRWDDAEKRPACCDVVPTLYRGPFNQAAIDDCLRELEHNGSVAAPGFMKPEGIVVYHTAGNVGFKKTILKDELSKSMLKEAA